MVRHYCGEEQSVLKSTCAVVVVVVFFCMKNKCVLGKREPFWRDEQRCSHLALCRSSVKNKTVLMSLCADSIKNNGVLRFVCAVREPATHVFYGRFVPLGRQDQTCSSVGLCR